MKKTLITTAAILFAMSTGVYAADNTPVHPLPKKPVKVCPVPKCDCEKPDCNCNKAKCDCGKADCNCTKFQRRDDFARRSAEFENRLKLTDEQKAKAKEIRQKGLEEIKPVMEKIKEKKAEMDAVVRSKIAEQAQKEKLDSLHKEIAVLKREAHELRMKNMKEFEGILTKKQTKELNKMKEEGRKNFAKKHNRCGCPEHRPDFRPAVPYETK